MKILCVTHESMKQAELLSSSNNSIRKRALGAGFNRVYNQCSREILAARRQGAEKLAIELPATGFEEDSPGFQDVYTKLAMFALEQ